MIATVEDIESALGEDISDESRVTVESLIGDATSLVEGHLHPAMVPNPVPDAVKRVVVRIVARYLTREKSGAPEGATGMMTTSGPWTRQVNFASASTDGGVWMVRQDRVMLRPFRHRRGIQSVDYTTGR